MSTSNEDFPENADVPAPVAWPKHKRIRKPAVKKAKPIGIVEKIANALSGDKKKAPAKKPSGKKAPAKKSAKATPKKAAGKKAPAKKSAKPTNRGKGPAGLKGKLHKMLLEKMPKRFQIDPNTLNFAELAAEQDMTTEGVYKWFRTDKIPPERALVFIKASAGKMKIADMIAFVFKA